MRCLYNLRDDHSCRYCICFGKQTPGKIIWSTTKQLTSTKAVNVFVHHSLWTKSRRTWFSLIDKVSSFSQTTVIRLFATSQLLRKLPKYLSHISLTAHREREAWKGPRTGAESTASVLRSQDYLWTAVNYLKKKKDSQQLLCRDTDKK